MNMGTTTYHKVCESRNSVGITLCICTHTNCLQTMQNVWQLRWFSAHHTHSHTHTRCTHTFTRTHTLSLSLSHTCKHTHAHTHAHTRTHTHMHAHARIHTCAHTHNTGVSVYTQCPYSHCFPVYLTPEDSLCWQTHHSTLSVLL